MSELPAPTSIPTPRPDGVPATIDIGDRAFVELTPRIEGLTVVVVSAAIALVLSFVLVLLLRSARFPPPTMVTMALATLTTLTLLIYAVTRSDAVVGLIGTGLGALAAAVTYQLAGGLEKTDARASLEAQAEWGEFVDDTERLGVRHRRRNRRLDEEPEDVGLDILKDKEVDD